ncbi:MAG TPA: nucleotidyltransferase domain-containing protein [Pricia sp.]|nr:nucleotidyltransferase domain-containing protein [Pricia sp.]
MNKSIKSNIDELRLLCEEHLVDSFFLFGSAAKDEMNQNSDFDFLVTFSDRLELLEYADNYFSFMERLKNLLGREVDLVSEKALKNPVLIEEINKTKVIIYESKGSKVSFGH